MKFGSAATQADKARADRAPAHGERKNAMSRLIDGRQTRALRIVADEGLALA